VVLPFIDMMAIVSRRELPAGSAGDAATFESVSVQ
jgi:hypothetical protein